MALHSASADPTRPPYLHGRWRPVLLLVVLSPVIAEVTIGDLPFTATGLVAAVFALPIYGAGALLIREVVGRRGLGWGAVLLLGVAYAVVEEGLALQSLFSPTIYGGLGPAWGARLWGVNGTYTVLQLVNHAVWSVAVPIALTDVAYPRRRLTPYLGRFGLGVTGVCYLGGVGLLVLTHAQLDPGYRAPVLLLVAALAVVVLLVLVALRSTPIRISGGAVPSPVRVAVVALVASFGFLAVLVLPGHVLPTVMRGPGAVLPLAVAVAIVVFAGRRIARWARTAGWDDRHVLALAGGATVGHTLLWGVTQPQTDTDRTGVLVLLALTLVFLAVLARARRQVGGTGAPARSRRTEGKC